MNTASPQKESTWPSSPQSAMYSPTSVSPHRPMPYSPHDAFQPVYDSHESHQSLPHRVPINQEPQEMKGYNYSQSQSLSVATRPGPGPWWMLGFERKSTVGLFIFFGGAVLGFSLSRTSLINYRLLMKLTTAGEGYWYEKAPQKASVIVHVVTALPASFFSVFLFLPITWNRWPKLHGIFGYILSILLVVSCACGAVLGRRAQGGDLNVQSGVYMLASAAVGAVIMGCVEARRGALDAHREWMLRAWFYNGSFVTTRVTALLSAQAITAINSYYSLWKCAEVGYVLKTAAALAQAYPQCATPNALADPTGVHVAVHSSWHEGKLGKASAIRASFGMSIWIAMILHFVGIEFYLRMTADESRKLLTARKTPIAELPSRMP